MNTIINQIQQYIANNQLQKAQQVTVQLIEKTPEYLYLHKLLAHIHGLKEESLKAIQILEKQLIKFPDDFDLNNNLGHYYFKAEDIEKSDFFIQKAKKINPDSPSPSQNAAELYLFMRKFDLAQQEIDHCLEINEAKFQDYLFYIPALLVKIFILIAQKKQMEAVEFIKKYLKINFNAELFLQLIQIDKKAVDPDLINHCKQQIEKKSYNSKMEIFQHLVPLYFSLALYYEKEDSNLSDEFYVKANKEIFSIQRLNMVQLQKQELQYMNTYKEIHQIKNLNSQQGEDNIFIVGLPRSGTTLLESVVTANKEVFAGGELNIFKNLLLNHLTDEKELTAENLLMIGEKYISATNQLKKEFTQIVDKLPMNSSYIGFILKSLPASKILLILRNPWDVAISLFKQRYVRHVPYSSSFFNIGVQVANFEASILSWLQYEDIKEKIFIVKYEELVSDMSNQREKIYQFCKIHEEYNASIREGFFAQTASMNQVQKGIHQSSIKKDNFSLFYAEFYDAFNSQRDYWKKQGLAIPSDYFGYILK